MLLNSLEIQNYKRKQLTDYALKKANPIIQKVGSEAINELSTKVRPDYQYKTDRMDLDGDMFKGVSNGII